MIHRLAGTIMIFYYGHFQDKSYRILLSGSHIKPVASGRALTFFFSNFSESHNVKKKKKKK